MFPQIMVPDNVLDMVRFMLPGPYQELDAEK